MGFTIGREMSYAPGPTYFLSYPFFFFFVRGDTDPKGAYDWGLL